ncbi:hypothetical protein [Yeosuana marina]|uniref:hypothetical protein n=1 Tax=Yeosuana marina TaxID=1565536 RepID=UPI0014242B88|nr:hypothetical protein [Yeosuana marina]
MYSISYKVNGQEDINDYMVMENESFFKYSEKTIKRYFKENKERMFQGGSNHDFTVKKKFLDKRKDLFFTNVFTVDIQIFEIDIEGCEMITKHNFFNQNNQLCAIIEYNLVWDNYS